MWESNQVALFEGMCFKRNVLFCFQRNTAKGKGSYSYNGNKENISFSMNFMVHWYGMEEKTMSLRDFRRNRLFQKPSHQLEEKKELQDRGFRICRTLLFADLKFQRTTMETW